MSAFEIKMNVYEVPPGYDNPEFEMHLVFSVKTGQKVRDLLFS